MRYFIDTEFMEDGKTIELLSIAICAQGSKREIYAENIQANLSRANPWVKENVIPQLWSQQKDKQLANEWTRDGGKGGLLDLGSIRREIIQFCDPAVYGPPEFWGYYCDYDWVVFCQLFGKMIDLPEGYPMLCMDLKQSQIEKGCKMLLEQPDEEHHALVDARWIRDCHAYLFKVWKPELDD